MILLICYDLLKRVGKGLFVFLTTWPVIYMNRYYEWSYFRLNDLRFFSVHVIKVRYLNTVIQVKVYYQNRCQMFNKLYIKSQYTEWINRQMVHGIFIYTYIHVVARCSVDLDCAFLLLCINQFYRLMHSSSNIFADKRKHDYMCIMFSLWNTQY